MHMPKKYFQNKIMRMQFSPDSTYAYNNNKRLQNDFKYTAQRFFNEKMTQDS